MSSESFVRGSLRALVSVALLLPVTEVLGQKDPVKWDEVSDEELAMTSHPDSSATAVILADYGDLSVQWPSGKVEMRAHFRVKILSEQGYDWATVNLVYNPDFERYRRIKGQTIKLLNGKKVRLKLEKSDIIDHDLTDDLKRISFTLPGLEPGAVIEYEYRYTRENPVLLPEWSFQSSEPVIISEFRAEMPWQFQYVVASTGVQDYTVQEHTEVVKPRGKSNRYRWVMRDVPALREEPFMTAASDHRAKLQLQMSAYFDRGFGMTPVSNSWDKLRDILLESETWKRYLKPDGVIRDAVKTIVTDFTQGTDILEALHAHIRNTIVWDKSNDYFPEQNPKDLFKTGRGSAADINLLMVGMARAAGLAADPVLLSTRSHGSVQQAYPLLDEFNYLVAAVTVAGETVLVDATDRYRPPDMLPARAINGKGWVVSKRGEKWITIDSDYGLDRKVRVAASIDEGGAIEGTIQIVDSGYRAAASRRKLDTRTEEEFVRETMLEVTDAEYRNFVVMNRDSVHSPLVLNVQFSTPNHAQVAGDFIYLNPMLIERWKSNPLRAPERSFPVDFNYKRRTSYQIMLTLPDGYVLAESPDNVKFGPSSGGAMFLKRTVSTDSTLTFESRLNIISTVYQPRDYEALRSFFERVVREQDAQVVLRAVDQVSEVE